MSPTSTRVVSTPTGPVRRSLGPALHSSEPTDRRFAIHLEIESRETTLRLRLQLERPRAESAAGSTARPGGQLVISVATRENPASSPGRPFCPAQDPWEQALVHELGEVFDLRDTVHPATEVPLVGEVRRDAGGIVGVVVVCRSSVFGFF